MSIPKTDIDGVNLREVIGTDGKYAAGDDGHIYCFSDAKVNARKPYPFQLSEHVGSNGYPFVQLWSDGAKRSARVHQLVCRAFHGEKPQNADCVRHKNGDKTDNRPSNLSWSTYSQNEADKKDHGTCARGENQGSAKLTEEEVIEIRNRVWDDMTTKEAADKFGVSRSHIRRVANGEWWEHV